MIADAWTTRDGLFVDVRISDDEQRVVFETKRRGTQLVVTARVMMTGHPAMLIFEGDLEKIALKAINDAEREEPKVTN